MRSCCDCVAPLVRGCYAVVQKQPIVLRWDVAQEQTGEAYKKVLWSDGHILSAHASNSFQSSQAPTLTSLPSKMMIKTSLLLAVAAFSSRVMANGWEQATRDLNYDSLCGSNPSSTPVHVCFVSSFSVIGIARNTNFHGFHDSTGTSTNAHASHFSAPELALTTQFCLFAIIV